MARILIIDDWADARDFMALALRMEGHEVVVAEDGDSGLKLQRGAPVDLLITDIFMPNKDGIETIMTFRGEFPGVKIVAISGGGSAGYKGYLQIAREIGADESLRKPFTIEELYGVTRKLLSGP